MGLEIRSFGVVGAGQMGTGIAQVAAQAGLNVRLVDLAPNQLNRARETMKGSLGKLAQKGKLGEDPEIIMGRIGWHEDMQALTPCEFIVEAVTENPDLKFGIFRKLDELCKPGTILASNTSSISITAIAGQTKRPDQVIGMHFMNPVPLMQLVEIISGLQTDQETVQMTIGLAKALGKETVQSKDRAGFIVNRVLLPMINGAIQTFEDGTADAEAIDRAMKLGTNQPKGPLALADLIGLDTCLSIMEVLHEAFGDRYKPAPLLRQYVDAGWLGRKTGRGFHRYDKTS